MSLIWIRMQLALQRFGLGNVCALLCLLLGLLGWLVWLPHLRLQNSQAQTAMIEVEQALKVPPSLVAPQEAAPSSEKNLARFYASLGEQEYVEQQIKTLFAIAKKLGLSLQQGEYKATLERQGGFNKYQIVLPLKGSYSLIRQFCEQVLVAIPFASLDELNFKRDSISNRVLETKLRFTLYLSNQAITPESAS